jgi:hypothetical protein
MARGRRSGNDGKDLGLGTEACSRERGDLSAGDRMGTACRMQTDQIALPINA